MAIEKIINVTLDGKQAQKNLELLNSTLEEQRDILIFLQKELGAVETKLKETPKNALSAQKKLRDEQSKLKDSIKDQSLSLKELGNERQKATKAVKKSADEQKNLAGVTGLADKATGGLFSRLKGLRGGLRTVTTGFKSLRVAIISSGVGALALGVLAVVQAFKRSEEGQNKFAKIMGVIGAVTGQFLDVLADVGEYIISAFTNPQKAISDFANLIKTNITNRFNAIIDTLGFLGSAFKKVFSGDFSGALEDAKKAGSSYVDSLTGVENSINKITTATKEFIKETSKEADIAANIADQRAKADKLERGLIVQRAKANRKIADLREKAENREKFSAAERIVFLKEAAKLDDDITAREIQNARLRFNAKKQENELGKSTKEDKKEEAELLVNLINLETTLFTKKKALTAKEQALIREDATFKKGIEDKKAEAKKEREEQELTKEQELFDLKNAIRDAQAISDAEKDLLEVEKTREKYDLLIVEAERFNLSTTELEAAKSLAISNLQNKSAEQNSKNTIKWEELTQSQKLTIASQGFKNLSNILGEETAAGKAAAVASAIISTYQSATDSYKSLSGIPVVGPVLGFAAAAAAVKSGFNNVKKITSTKIPGGKSGGGVSTPSAPSLPPSRPPSFNIVGASGTNQLADVINTRSGEQTSELKGSINNQTQAQTQAIQEGQTAPIKAYVVSDEVTSMQGLERNAQEETGL